ncbi:nose resistant to fluoxetine protein 6-like isoform X2 [Asterias amurensis]|uniref:nose resistant to fluoxetine protein 6-like isoform X2 n=1 Tax=Asterias amurensis TaxID=7602 RepID=UPI003AB609D0
MRQQMQQLTAAWLILMMHALTASCSNINTNIYKTSSDEALFDQSGLQIPGGYLREPAHLHAPTPGNISQECQEDLYQLLNTSSLEYQEESRALDAFGKPGSGLLVGNTAWLGSYDECMDLEEFNYCLAYMYVQPKGFQPALIHWGVCTPASCSGEDVQNALKTMFVVLGDTSTSYVFTSAAGVSCATNPPIPYNAGFYCTVILFVTIGVLMIGGALYAEYLKLVARRKPDSLHQTSREEDDVPLLGNETNQRKLSVNNSMEVPKVGIFGRFLLCFAFTLNLSKLMDTRQKDTSIRSMNGIRFISMTWVILGHTLFFIIVYGITTNPVSAVKWLEVDFGFQVVANAFFAVDTFFFLSGCLVSYLTLSRMKELKSVKAWLWFYFHRYWRLTPVLIVTLLVNLYIQPFFGDGPIWQSTTARPLCHQSWWTNLLYINNFYPQDFGHECLSYTWYLANDMQFFIISPLILVPLYYSPILGWIILCALAIISMVTTGVIVGVYDVSINILDQFIPKPGTGGPGLNYGSLVYEKPYCRIAPYLVGIGLGYILHRIGKRRVKMSPLLAIAGWVLATGIGMSVVYGLYPSYHAAQDLSKTASIIYISMSRFAWGVALAWVVFACNYGHAGWINSFLSWSGFVPLSRLTYCAYMFHPLVLMTFYPNFGTGIYLSKFLMANYFAGFVAISYFLAMVVSIAVEFPFANLEKLFMPDNPREKHERNSQVEGAGVENVEA